MSWTMNGSPDLVVRSDAERRAELDATRARLGIREYDAASDGAPVGPVPLGQGWIQLTGGAWGFFYWAVAYVRPRVWMTTGRGSPGLPGVLRVGQVAPSAAAGLEWSDYVARHCAEVFARR